MFILYAYGMENQMIIRPGGGGERIQKRLYFIHPCLIIKLFIYAHVVQTYWQKLDLETLLN